MVNPKGQYKFKRIRGVSDLILRDDKRLRRKLMEFSHLRPMLEENCFEPTFDQLKSVPEFKDFLRQLGGEPIVVLLVSAKAGVNIEKGVGVLGSNDRLCALCSWERETGDIYFRVIN